MLWPPGSVVMGGVRVVEGKNEVLRRQNNHLGAARESGGVLLGNASGTREEACKVLPLWEHAFRSDSHMMLYHVMFMAHHVVPAPPPEASHSM